MNYKIYNTDRSAGAMFSGYLAKIYGHEGLKDNSITINLEGTAGQSFAAFTSYGITLILQVKLMIMLEKVCVEDKLIYFPQKILKWFLKKV